MHGNKIFSLCRDENAEVHSECDGNRRKVNNLLTNIQKLVELIKGESLAPCKQSTVY